MELGKIGYGRELNLLNIKTSLMPEDLKMVLPILFFLPIIWTEGWNSSMKICQMMN